VRKKIQAVSVEPIRMQDILQPASASAFGFARVIFILDGPVFRQ
jgi:hypothetical protein